MLAFAVVEPSNTAVALYVTVPSVISFCKKPIFNRGSVVDGVYVKLRSYVFRIFLKSETSISLGVMDPYAFCVTAPVTKTFFVSFGVKVRLTH